jgi:hypothetical protein
MEIDNSQLAARVHEAMLSAWDPIGIQGFAEAHDEYDSYVPEICALLRRRATVDEVFAYLWRLETEHMGLRGDREKTEQFAAQIARFLG